MSWLISDDATIANGREIGIEARIGETMADYRTRLRTHCEAANEQQQRCA